MSTFLQEEEESTALKEILDLASSDEIEENFNFVSILDIAEMDITNKKKKQCVRKTYK